MAIFKKLFPLVLILLLSYPVITPLLIDGFFPMHDDTQPTRVYEMAKALTDGQFPVRWVADLGYGYGYPLFNFYAPLPYYFGAGLVLLGFDLLIATKYMFAVGTLISGIFMFLLGKRLWGTWGGVVSSILYIYAPYHAVQIYVRGSVGEYWAYGFLPLIIYGILEARNRQFFKGIVVGSLALAALILSHNIIGFLTIGLLILWCSVELIKKYFFSKQKNYLFALVVIIILGLGLSTFFWLPAILESNLTKINSLTIGMNDFHQHFVYLDQLWDSPWGYAGSSSGRSDGISFKIGKVHLILGFIVAVLILISKFRQKIKNTQLLLFVSLFLGFGFSIFIMISTSKFIWESIALMKYIQFPWRFLVFNSFFISLISGGLITLIAEKSRENIFLNLFVMSIIFIIILLNAKYFSPQFIRSQKAEDYADEKIIKWKISKISDEYLAKDFPIPQIEEETNKEKIIISDDIIIKQQEIKTHRWHLTISALKRAEIIFSLAYFPGWQVFLDGNKIKPLVINGLLSVTVAPGEHVITSYFSNTLIRTTGNWISVFSAVVLLILIAVYSKGQKYEKT